MVDSPFDSETSTFLERLITDRFNILSDIYFGCVFIWMWFACNPMNIDI